METDKKKRRPRGPGRPIKKGQALNPRGRPRITDEERRDRQIKKEGEAAFQKEWEKYKFDRRQLRLKIFQYLTYTQNEIIRSFSNPAMKSLDSWIVSIIHQGVNTADEKKLLFLLDQALGKLPNTIGLDKDDTDSWAALVSGLRDANLND